MTDRQIISIDPNKLTLGEIAELEELTGTAVSALFDGKKNLSAKALVAIVYLVKRRTDATFTLEDARAIPIGDLAISGPEPDPTGAAASESWRPSVTSLG